MKTLNLYIGRGLLVTTGIAIGVLTFVMLSANLMKVFELLARGVEARVLVQFLGYLAPEMLKFTIPMAVLCSSVLVFSRLAADNEVNAMRASGVSLWQIISPGLVLSILLSGVCLWLQTSVSPHCLYQVELLKRTEAVRNPLVLIEPGRFVELPGYVIRVGGREGHELYDIHVYALDEDGRVAQDITARKGRIVLDEGTRVLQLLLEDTTIAAVDPAKDETGTRFWRSASRGISFPLNYGEEMDKRPLTRKLKHMDFPMIFAWIYIEGSEGRDTTAHYVELNKRVSLALSPFAFLLIGIPFGIRTRRAETSVGLLVCVFLAMGFYTFILLAEGLESKPALHPEILVWLPNVLYQGGGLWTLAVIARR